MPLCFSLGFALEVIKLLVLFCTSFLPVLLLLCFRILFTAFKAPPCLQLHGILQQHGEGKRIVQEAFIDVQVSRPA